MRRYTTVILSQQEIVCQQSRKNDFKRLTLTVLIRAKDAAKYKNIVAILEEMTIADITRYAILDYTAADSLIHLCHPKAKDRPVPDITH